MAEKLDRHQFQRGGKRTVTCGCVTMTLLMTTNLNLYGYVAMQTILLITGVMNWQLLLQMASIFWKMKDTLKTRTTLQIETKNYVDLCVYVSMW